MPKIVCIGEAMGELRPDGDSTLHMDFSGDAFNTAAYAKMLGEGDWDVTFLTAIGGDPISSRFNQRCDTLEINLIANEDAENPLGLYSISTDAHGERTFSYWRNASPARHLVDTIPREGEQALGEADTIFLTGITLAILNDAQRGVLLEKLRILRSDRTSIAFDPNFRKRLWRTRRSAQSWTARYYEVSDIVFPGIEDERELFGHDEAEKILAQSALAGADEVIVKAGRDGVIGRTGNKTFTTPFVQPSSQVDTTACGDAFNAAWLVARAKGCDAQQSAAYAASVAATVAGHRGAIITKEQLPTLQRQSV